jgi:hypothetical protein
MENPEPILRQIQGNDRRLQICRQQLSQLAANDPERQKTENEIGRIVQSQLHWWNRLIHARGVTNYNFGPQRIRGRRPPSPSGKTAAGGLPSGKAGAAGSLGPGSSTVGPESSATDPKSLGAPISVKREQCADFSQIVGTVVIRGRVCVTGSLSLKPKSLSKLKHVSFDSNYLDATQTGQVVFDSALASAKSSVTYDSTTKLFDASISTSLKVGDGSISFSQPSFVTGAVQGMTLTLESTPKPIKGSTSQFDIQGAIGLKVTVTVSNVGTPDPVPIITPVPRTSPIPQASPKAPTPFWLPPAHVLICPILVPWGIFRKALEEADVLPPQA